MCDPLSSLLKCVEKGCDYLENGVEGLLGLAFLGLATRTRLAPRPGLPALRVSHLRAYSLQACWLRFTSYLAIQIMLRFRCDALLVREEDALCGALPLWRYLPKLIGANRKSNGAMRGDVREEEEWCWERTNGLRRG